MSETEPKLCGAKSRKHGGTCKNRPCKGRKRCRMHGGTAKRGPDSHKFLHGQRSTYMQTLGEYQQLMENPMELMNLLHQLAGMEMLMKRAVERVTDLDTPAFRDRAKRQWRELRGEMFGGGDVGRIAQLAKDLGALIERGAEHDRAESHLLTTMERFSKRVEEAWKIRLSSQGRIDPDTLKRTLGTIATIIQEEADGPVAARILARFHSEIVEGSRTIALPGSTG